MIITIVNAPFMMADIPSIMLIISIRFNPRRISGKIPVGNTMAAPMPNMKNVFL